MFKLVKIEGSGTNQAEPIRIKTAPTIPYKAHCAYTLFDGFLAGTESNMTPTHIALENLEGDEKSSVLCYRIQENMVFEVPLSATTNSLSAGYKYAIDIDSEGAGMGMTPSTTNGILTLQDANGASKRGDPVYVQIIK